MMAALVVGGLAALGGLCEKSPRDPVATPSGAATLVLEGNAAAPRVPAAPAPVLATVAPPVERPIEEILAESGEDPGAVYYMSRVREALRDGNPTFARELFRQMKEEHSSSVLLEEAEALLEKAR